MGKAYRDATGKIGSKKTTKQMRELSQRPGTRDEDGNLVYMTEQSHKDMCDVNKIIRKYDRDGLITHVSKFEAHFGDVTGLEFKAAQDQVIAAQRMFDDLPSNIRKEFGNDPGNLLSFMDNPDNRDKAIELGLIRGDWSIDQDGIGEHVIRDDKGKVQPQQAAPEPSPEPST